MAIQNRRGNFVDFDPFKMLPGEFAYSLDTEDLYYCVSPGNVKRCATKEEVIEILETSQEAYDGLQQLLTELENETVLTGMLADISQLLNDVAINKANIGDLVNYVGDLTTLTTFEKSNIVGALNEIDAKHKSHLAESANKHITESGSNNNGYYIKFDDGTMICYGTFYREAPVTSAIGGMFRTNATISPPSPPASFIGRPLKLFNPIWDSANTDAIIFGILEQSGNNRVDIFTPISHSLLKIDIGYLYIGRWK